MQFLISMCLRSLKNRRLTTSLTLLSVSLSVALLLGIERVHEGARRGFESTISQTDLIVGGRTSPLQLMLYTVFRMGTPSNNVSWESYQELSRNPEIAWTIPISLGDSHRGFAVVGTNGAYLEHFRYGGDKSLKVGKGVWFQKLFHAVIGAEVAEELRYTVGQKVTLAHGSGEVVFQEHGDKPFEIVGILEPTGTPVDRSIHVSLEALTALHVDWKDGGPPRPGQETSVAELEGADLTPHSITAFLVGLRSKLGIFKVQREINQYEEEALSAILPGMTLQELWGILGVAERALTGVSLLVFFVTLMVMLIALLTSLGERRREMAIYRSLGAGPSFIVMMLLVESFLVTLGGIVMGYGLVLVSGFVAQPYLEKKLGFSLSLVVSPGVQDLQYMGLVLLGSMVVGLIPAAQAYRNSLADGLSVRV